ncbi:MAG TPA: hypothetical protein VI172_04985 [Candidatus Dormibacteraeota bacterium]|jgi:hypothetical protein
MRDIVRFLAIVGVVSSVASVPIWAEECDASSLEKAVENECTVLDVYNHYHDDAMAKAEPAAKAVAQEAVSDEVKQSNRATTAPDGFASRLHNSYQDFLVPFAFAINKVEESKDGQALIVRFNALRSGILNAGFTATAAKPAVDDRLKAAIPEPQRSETTSALEKSFGDFDDVTVTLALTANTKRCDPGARFCFGRNPETYRRLLSESWLLVAPIDASTSEDADVCQEHLIRDVRAQGFARQLGLNVKLSDAPADGRSRLYATAQDCGMKDAKDSRAYLNELKGLHVVENVASLIDNQPQISLNVSRRDLGRFNGPDQTAISLEVQFGPHNLNALLHGEGDLVARIAEGMVRKPAAEAQNEDSKQETSPVASDKFVLTASYTLFDRFQVADLEAASVDGFSPLDLPSTDEWKGKLQWGRKLATHMAGSQPRLDVSGEWNLRSEGSKVKRNRLVATATLTVPYGKSLSFPVSLTYSNKPEFLTDQRRDLSMHFGLSYRLPWEKGE